jgi:hypothetical protein
MILAVDTSGDPTLLDRSFDHIRGLDGRWGSLAGDVVATGADLVPHCRMRAAQPRDARS